MSFELQFLGGAGTVTGSKTLLTYNGKKILIDCGLFQGLKSLRLKNWDEFPLAVSEIDAVILTHGHIDHSGYIPRLIKNGFKGKIYCTAATKEICEILLPDCGYLLEEEAAYLNKIGKTKHKPALPLFTLKEATESLKYFSPVPFESLVKIAEDFSFHFQYVGHILGAGSLNIQVGNETIAFTGDVGRPNDEILFDPKPLPAIDYIVTESTYGNRLHEPNAALEALENIVNSTVEKNGVILIPAFAVGRAQMIMYYLTILRRQNRIPKIPMYVNSPMASNFSKVFEAYQELHKLDHKDFIDMNNLFNFVGTADESKALNEKEGSMLIISASGMLTGGRILHHMKAFAPLPETSIVLVGFQSAGTRGEALANGAKETKIHGAYVPVNAKVHVLENMSAHADYRELIKWFEEAKIKPKRVYINHGEPSASDELRRRIEERFGWDCMVPDIGAKFKS